MPEQTGRPVGHLYRGLRRLRYPIVILLCSFGQMMFFFSFSSFFCIYLDHLRYHAWPRGDENWQYMHMKDPIYPQQWCYFLFSFFFDTPSVYMFLKPQRASLQFRLSGHEQRDTTNSCTKSTSYFLFGSGRIPHGVRISPDLLTLPTAGVEAGEAKSQRLVLVKVIVQPQLYQQLIYSLVVQPVSESMRQSKLVAVSRLRNSGGDPRCTVRSHQEVVSQLVNQLLI